MTIRDADAEESTMGRRVFEFVLRVLFVGTAFLGVVSLGLFAAPGRVGGVTFLITVICLPAVATVGLIYGRGYVRTFCFGALFPAGLLLWCLAMMCVNNPNILADVDTDRWKDHGHLGLILVTFVGIPAGASVGVGLLAMGARRVVEGPRRRSAGPGAGETTAVPASENVGHTTSSRGTSFQYCLRTLLVLTTVLAVACSALFAAPARMQVLSALFLVTCWPAILTIILIYGRGYARTFSVGALFPAGLVLVFLPLLFLSAYSHIDAWKLLGEVAALRVVIPVVMSIATGLLAMGVRWMIEASRQDA